MSDGHTPLNGQDGLSYDFAEIPSKYDDPSQKDRYNRDPMPEIFDAENSDDVVANHPEQDDYHPEDFDSDAFVDSVSKSPRDLGSAALNKSRQEHVDRDHNFDAAAEFARISRARHPRNGSTSNRHAASARNSGAISNRFRSPQTGEMPMPTKFDSSIVNLPPPGVIPDPSEIALPTDANFQTEMSFPTEEASPAETLSQPESQPDNAEITPERPLESPEQLKPLQNPRKRHRKNSKSIVNKFNPLTTTSTDEDKFQGEKGHLGGRAKQELRDGQRALDHGDTESAYRYFRNAMAGFVGEYANRSAQDFHARMWKDHPQEEAQK